VDDREGDIYPKWASVPQDNFPLLTRAMVDHRLANPETKAAPHCSVPLRALPWLGRGRSSCLRVSPIAPNARSTVEIRFGEAEVPTIRR
jgi:hypothetical protein